MFWENDHRSVIFNMLSLKCLTHTTGDRQRTHVSAIFLKMVAIQ